MTETLTILTIPGSLRAGSTNRLFLRAAEEEAPAGARVELWDDLAALPAFDEDIESPAPPAVEAFRDALARADAVLISTPEYNGSIPGALKNAVDWASRPAGSAALTGKPVAVIGASPSPFGAAWAQAELRKSLAIAGARVIEKGASLGKAASRLDADGRLTDDAVRQELGDVWADLRAAALDTVRAAA